ncbi:MAG: tetratricopeptide repeat protein [Actinomycetota bacterium]|nr:tetratricopeptide repeat protein [Actinomycetota bacterium]
MTVKKDDVGERIRELRRRRGLSQEQLSAPNYTPAYISYIEQGKRSPSHEALSHIATRLGVDVEQLLSGRDPDDDLRLEIEIERAISEIHSGAPVDAALRILKQSRKKAAEVGYERALERAELGFALAKYRTGDVPGALAGYERAYELVKDDLPARHTAALVGQARCLFQLGEAREAIHLLESHLLDLKSEDPPDPSAELQTYAALIPLYFESGMTESAKSAARKGWKLAPATESAEARACLYVNRATLMMMRKQTREALASLALADEAYRHLGWSSESTKVNLARALVLIDEGELDAAEELLDDSLSKELSVADKVRAMCELAFLKRTRGEPGQALTIAKQALSLAGTTSVSGAAEAAREVGLCSRLLGDHKTAVSMWRKAIKLYANAENHEEMAKTANLLGDHLFETGDLKAAVVAYKQGLASVTRVR